MPDGEGPRLSLGDLISAVPYVAQRDLAGLFTAFVWRGTSFTMVTGAFPGFREAGGGARVVAGLIAGECPGADSADLACFSPPGQQAAAALAQALPEAAAAAGFSVGDVVRVEGDRFWSLLRESPPEGQRVPDIAAVAAKLTEWHVAARYGPVRQAAAGADRYAAAVRECFPDLRLGADGPAAEDFRRIAEAGIEAVADAVQRYREGGEIRDRAVLARVSVALRNAWTLSDAWARMEPGCCRDHRRLWTAVAGAAVPGYADGPCGLASFTALQAGDVPGARDAARRALAGPGAGAGRQLAARVDILLDAGLTRWQEPPCTCEEVAGRYRRLLGELGAGPGPGS